MEWIKEAPKKPGLYYWREREGEPVKLAEVFYLHGSNELHWVLTHDDHQDTIATMPLYGQWARAG